MDAAGLAMELAPLIQQFDPTRPLSDAYTPPSVWYTDPRFLVLEKETLFRQRWQFVGRTDQVSRPGDYFCGDFMGWPFVVVRGHDDILRAFYNVCAHHGTCVAKGQGRTEKLVCPYHGWTYDLEGQLRKAPKAGAIDNLREKGMRLKPIAVRQWGPLVLVHFGSGSCELPFDSQLDKLNMPGLSFIARKTYDLACNWKVFIDNYLDGGYHVPQMHPDLNGQLAFQTYHSEVYAGYSVQSCEAAAEHCDGRSARDDRIGDRARYVWVSPNFAINRYGNWMDTNRVIPTGVNSCRTIFDYYHKGALTETQRNTALAASHQVQLEDMDICSMVQNGLESGVYERGIYAPRFEAPMYAFHREIANCFNKALGNNAMAV